MPTEDPGGMAEPAPRLPRVAPGHRFAVAPMLNRTDRHYRALARGLTRHAVLYTEMRPAAAVMRASDRWWRDEAAHGPVVLQLGGSDPALLAQAARRAGRYGFAGVNLNIGCPSPRVQRGRFGACLMLEPGLVAECVAAMAEAGALPVSIKTRIGVDHHDQPEVLLRLVAAVRERGCRQVVVHARKAWLRGLSPRENRRVPALDPARVFALKAAFPDLSVVLNGGLADLDSALRLGRLVDGVMLGRAAYDHPWLLADVDRRCYGEPGPATDRATVLHGYLRHARRELARGTPWPLLAAPLAGLYRGCPGARAWRRRLADGITAVTPLVATPATGPAQRARSASRRWSQAAA